MRRIRGQYFAFCVTFVTGCFSARNSAPDSFMCQALRNTVEAPIRDLDEVRFLKRTRRQAEDYWLQFHDRGACKCSLDAYHDGFVEGFVDYVQAGGTGEPPYLPPFRYRLTNSHTPDGVARIEDWYAGFRQGAAVARASGLRELTVFPLPAYAILKDPNAIDSPVVTTPSLEGSPWEKPGTLPMPVPLMPIPIPPKTEPIPIPQPRPVSMQNVPPGQPLMFPQPPVPAGATPLDSGSSIAVRPQVVPASAVSAPRPAALSYIPPSQPPTLPQYSVPPAVSVMPRVSESPVPSSVPTIVVPASAIVRPPANPSNPEADIWSSASPRGLAPKTGSN